MGRDKTENELLIKYGMPEDVWFHVDSMSSAHVYLRRKRGQNTLEGIDPGLLQDCAQLVKHNSIKGRKLPDVKVSYTLWSNLRKTGDMVEGQIGFHRPKAVMKVHVERDREVVKRLLKTMTERMIKLFSLSLSLSLFKIFIIIFSQGNPDFIQEKQDREKLEQQEARQTAAAVRAAEQEAIKKSKEEAKLKSYESLFNDFGASDSDESSDGAKNFEEYEDNFM